MQKLEILLWEYMKYKIMDLQLLLVFHFMDIFVIGSTYTLTLTIIPALMQIEKLLKK